MSRPEQTAAWPAGAGTMAARIREHDWAATPLGPIGGWPASLTTIVDLALASQVPMVVLWSPRAIVLYNDACAAIMGERQRSPLGLPVGEAFPELGDLMVAPLAQVWRGDTRRLADQRYPVFREGAWRDAWFDVALTPIRDGADVAGVLAIVSETTERVLAERERDAMQATLRESETRQALLLKLSDTLRPLSDAAAIQAAAARVLGEHLCVSSVAYGEVVGDEVVVTRDYVGAGGRSLAGTYRMADYGASLVAAMRQGRTVVVPEVATSAELSPEQREAYAAVGVGALAGVPLVKEGRFVAYLNVHDRGPRMWTATDIGLLEATAERTWAAVERARAEAALRVSEAKVRTLLTTMDQGFCVIEKMPTAPGAPSDFRYLETNPAFDRHTGLRDVVGHTLRELVPGVEPAIVELYDEVARTGRPARFERYVADLDRWIAAEVIPAQERNQVVVLFSDVTARKRAEAALRESEARHRAIWEATTDAMAISAPDGTVLAANPAYCALYGYAAEEVIGHSFAVIFPEEQRAWAEQQHRAVFAMPELPPVFQSHVRRRDGTERIVESRASFIVERGERVAMVSAIRDITARAESEAALRASEERLRRMVNIQGVGVLTFTTDGTLIDANDAFLAMTGYTREQVQRGEMTWREMTPAEYVAVSEAQMGRIEREGRIGPYEKEYFHADGSRSWMLFAGASLGDGTVVEYCIDISDRKRFEAALRGSEARFRAVANLVPDLLWQSAPDGANEWYNDRWYAYTGQTRAEAAGWGWAEAIHPDDRDRAVRRYARATASGTPLRLEMRIRDADGAHRWFLARAEPLRDPGGRIIRWFGAATDVHEAMAARDELEGRVAAATAELRSLSHRLLVVQEEERRHLARELHDEIGQVLTGLSLNLRPGLADPESRMDDARRLVHDLTNQVRQLSMDLRPAALDSHGLLPALAWHIELYQNRTGVRVDLRHEGVERRFPPAVEIVAYRVVQEALTNVARHAGTRDATVRLVAIDGSLVVSVRDRGGGFTPGGLVGSSGINGMRERVRLVGGSLEIDTAPGEGTVVMAELPITEAAADEVGAEP